MMVTIRTTDGEFTIDGYQWTGDDAAVVEFLNSRLSPLGPSGADPDPDYSEALAVLELLGGVIVAHEEPGGEPGRIY